MKTKNGKAGRTGGCFAGGWGSWGAKNKNISLTFGQT